MSAAPLLEVTDLRVEFRTRGGVLPAVRGVSLRLEAGQTLGIVGESGSGKSVTMMAAMGLLPPSAHVTGSVRLAGRELLGLGAGELQAVRGARMAMIFQDPMSALNPVMTVGAQIVEAIRPHNRDLSARAALERAVELLATVSIPQPRDRVRQYPHEFSGGMRQRVMIAMAVANQPDLLIADEPTTALDVTVQAQILDMLTRLREELGIGLVLITHDLGVVAGCADAVAVMYAGRVVETAGTDDLFYRTRHPYTIGLLGAVPRVEGEFRPLVPVEGAPPTLSRLPAGCAFHPRCGWAIPRCQAEAPELRVVGAVHSACHRAEDLAPEAVP
ncbi:ABC transporter ATP-binding protein [Thalassobaculum sp.]|uniref:ABC transporter ATP-binding protein n=1 Tax=Thalassobaculum sp. TaxID=2022740 RepID=UPI0032ED0B68